MSGDAFNTVSAEVVRARIDRLKAGGMTNVTIAEATGLSRTRIADLACRSYAGERVLLRTYEKLVAIPTPPLTPKASEDFKADAACKGQTDVMFPHRASDGPGGDHRSWARARRICARCPVIDECWEWAKSEYSARQFVINGAMYAGRTPDEAQREVRREQRRRRERVVG